MTAIARSHQLILIKGRVWRREMRRGQYAHRMQRKLSAIRLDAKMRDQIAEMSLCRTLESLRIVGPVCPWLHRLGCKDFLESDLHVHDHPRPFDAEIERVF